MLKDMIKNFPGEFDFFDCLMDSFIPDTKIREIEFTIKSKEWHFCFSSIIEETEKEKSTTILNNLREITNENSFNEKLLNTTLPDTFISKHIRVEAVLFNNVVIAIGNISKTLFLPINDMSQLLTTEELISYINKLIQTQAEEILKEFSSNAVLFKEFLEKNKQFIPNLNINQFEDLKKLVTDICKII